MILYEIAYPDEEGNDVVEVLTEEEILSYYYPYWKERMESVGRHELISRERCLEDWVTIHWAMEIRIPL
jgi:hypothetical protein